MRYRVSRAKIAEALSSERHLIGFLGTGGAEGSRTPDLLIANEALYQLSYGPRLDTAAGVRAREAAHKVQRPELSRRRTTLRDRRPRR